MILLVKAISHTLLDYFSRDTEHPYGVPLLWPLDNTYYISSVLVFSDFARSGEPGMAFIYLFSIHIILLLSLGNFYL